MFTCKALLALARNEKRFYLFIDVAILKVKAMSIWFNT